MGNEFPFRANEFPFRANEFPFRANEFSFRGKELVNPKVNESRIVPMSNREVAAAANVRSDVKPATEIRIAHYNIINIFIRHYDSKLNKN